jgi:cobalamin biosynthesis Mg chelatase CobN
MVPRSTLSGHLQVGAHIVLQRGWACKTHERPPGLVARAHVEYISNTCPNLRSKGKGRKDTSAADRPKHSREGRPTTHKRFRSGLEAQSSTNCNQRTQGDPNQCNAKATGLEYLADGKSRESRRPLVQSQRSWLVGSDGPKVAFSSTGREVVARDPPRHTRSDCMSLCQPPPNHPRTHPAERRQI